MNTLYFPKLSAFLRYHDLPGENPARIYLPALGTAASGTFINVATHPQLVGHRSVLVDFFGSGFSDRPTEFSYSLEDHALTVAQLLDYLGLQGCEVIGHSLGGSVAITLAALRPDLVSRLVVAEGNLDPGGGGLSKQVAAQSEQEFVQTGFNGLLEGISAAAAAGNEALAVMTGMFRVAAPHAFYRGAVALVEGTQPTMRERFYRMSIPRAYILGERSVPLDESSAAPDAPYPGHLTEKGIHVVVVLHAGHLMMWDNPEGFATALKEALTI